MVLWAGNWTASIINNCNPKHNFKTTSSNYKNVLICFNFVPYLPKKTIYKYEKYIHLIAVLQILCDSHFVVRCL